MASARSDYKKIQSYFRAAAAVAVFMLTFGAVFYHIVEKLNWLDAFYFCTITLTTVGYGDITPHTSLGKFFTIFYVIAGVGILATFANLFIRRAVAKREVHRELRGKGSKND